MMKNILSFSYKKNYFRQGILTNYYNIKFNDFSNQYKSNNDDKKMTINITNDKNKLIPSKTLEIIEKTNLRNELIYERSFGNYNDGNIIISCFNQK